MKIYFRIIRHIAAIPVPENDISLAVILLPGAEGGNGTRTNGPRKASDQFDSRREELSRSIPWATVVPYFREDWASILLEAKDRQSPAGNSAERCIVENK